MTHVGKRVRVVVVDDSMFMRAAIKKALSADGRFQVVGEARDGREGVKKVLELAPDVVTMDFNMPEQDGIGAVREIMAQRPTPILMFSAHTREGARETFEALAAGAVDFCTKPAGEVSATLRETAVELCEKLWAAASASPRAQPPAQPLRRRLRSTTWPPGHPPVVFVAVSTGGPAALTRVIPQLPPDIKFGMVIIQHMPAQFTATLAERLDSLSQVSVREAVDGDVPRAALVLLAPGDVHLHVEERGVLRLQGGAPVNGCRPSADVTMIQAAPVFGKRCFGLVMTGMGRDGAAGLDAIKRHGGRTVAQDQASSVIFGMPKAAIDSGAVDEVLPLDEIAEKLIELCMPRPGNP